MQTRVNTVDPTPTISLSSILGARKSALLESFNTNLLCYYKSRAFRADIQTIGFIGSLIAAGQTSAVVIDMSEVPLMVESLVELNELLIEKYNSAANEYLVRMNDARNLRTIRTAIDRG